MWSKRPYMLIRGLLSLLIAVVVMMLTVSWYVDRLTTTWTDQGSRPLVIIATRGGDAAYTTHLTADVDVDGDLTFAFFLTTEDLIEDDRARSEVEFQVFLIGEEIDEHVVCGGSDSKPDLVDVNDLPAGPALAYRTDQISERGSATNYRDSDEEERADDVADDVGIPSPSATEEAAESATEVGTFSGRILTWREDERWSGYEKHTTNENGDLFVESCTLDSSLVWRMAHTDDVPMESAHSTLLIPKFDLTSIDEKTDHQRMFDVSVWVDRAEGATIAEAYPAPLTRSTGWSLDLSVAWKGALGQEGNYAYADQPTWLMSNRDAAKAEQRDLIWGGMLLGLVVTLLVRGLSDLGDAAIREARRTSDVRTPDEGQARSPSP